MTGVDVVKVDMLGALASLVMLVAEASHLQWKGSCFIMSLSREYTLSLNIFVRRKGMSAYFGLYRNT